MNFTTRWKVFLVILVVILMWLSIGVSHRLIIYDRGNYNCTHMSRDFEDVVESFGIPVTLIRGSNDNNGHMWVKVFSIEFDTVFLIPFPQHLRFPKSQHEFDDWEDYCRWTNVEP